MHTHAHYMASLYQRPRSPFWWVSYRDARTGRITRRSTRFRVGQGTDTRKARQLCAEYTLAEACSNTAKAGENWPQWVLGYLGARYPNRLSLSRLKGIWANLSLYLEQLDIPSPRALTRAHCLGYVAWRSKPDKAQGKFAVCHNTAIQEIKALSMLMAEAVRRGYAIANPCRDLGLRLAARKIRPELTDADLLAIQAAIETEPEPQKTFFRVSFLISRYQGCRIAETWLNPMTAVDLKKGTIRFWAKGGKFHETLLHPKLVPLFADMQARQLTETYPRHNNPALWHQFFRRHGFSDRIPGICFHSLRVTAATRMARAKIPEAMAMRVLGHASTTIHRTYQRLKLEDLGDAMEALS